VFTIGTQELGINLLVNLDGAFYATWNAFKGLAKLTPARRKSGLVDSELDSQLKCRGFKSRLIQTLNGNGVKAMPG